MSLVAGLLLGVLMTLIGVTIFGFVLERQEQQARDLKSVSAFAINQMHDVTDEAMRSMLQEAMRNMAPRQIHKLP